MKNIMKKVKLIQAKRCYLILLLPLILPAVLFVASVLFCDLMPESSKVNYLPLAAIVYAIATVAFAAVKFGAPLLVTAGAVMDIARWNKDRRFFFTDINGRTAEEAVNAIQFRMKYRSKELEITDKSGDLVGAYKKRRHSFRDNTSGFEEYFILYRTTCLTDDFCSNAVADSKKIMQKFAEKGALPFLLIGKKRKKPVTRSCALVIVCDSIGSFNAEEYVRRSFSKAHTGLAVCIYESAGGRYYLNGKTNTLGGFLSESAEEISASLIKRVVFCKKMGLSENSYYMPEDGLPYSPETALYDAFADVKNTVKDSENKNKKISQNLSDGEVYFDGDAVFYKKNGRTLLFTVIDEEECEGEEKTDKKYVLTDKNWSYPKLSKMSKKDFDEVLGKINEYLNTHGINFEFKDFEQWLEEK